MKGLHDGSGVVRDWFIPSSKISWSETALCCTFTHSLNHRLLPGIGPAPGIGREEDGHGLAIPRLAREAVSNSYWPITIRNYLSWQGAVIEPDAGKTKMKEILFTSIPPFCPRGHWLSLGPPPAPIPSPQTHPHLFHLPDVNFPKCESNGVSLLLQISPWTPCHLWDSVQTSQNSVHGFSQFGSNLLFSPWSPFLFIHPLSQWGTS